MGSRRSLPVKEKEKETNQEEEKTEVRMGDIGLFYRRLLQMHIFDENHFVKRKEGAVTGLPSVHCISRHRLTIEPTDGSKTVFRVKDPPDSLVRIETAEKEGLFRIPMGKVIKRIWIDGSCITYYAAVDVTRPITHRFPRMCGSDFKPVHTFTDKMIQNSNHPLAYFSVAVQKNIDIEFVKEQQGVPILYALSANLLVEDEGGVHYLHDKEQKEVSSETVTSFCYICFSYHFLTYTTSKIYTSLVLSVYVSISRAAS